ncbi:MAG: phosphoribosylanthranilate isomerase [Flavobacterium sp.]
MKNYDNILEVSKLEPDYMGFIFWKKSPRYFEGIIPELPISIKKVGVFVNASITEILSKVKEHNLDLIQLHGQESVSFCKQLKSHNIITIKAFSIDNNFNFNTLKEYKLICDYFLFDAKGKQPGGNGFAFDWDILKNYTHENSYFLSGGISLDNIIKINDFQYIIKKNNFLAIDVNSKFETEPGIKKITELFELKKMLYENEL